MGKPLAPPQTDTLSLAAANLATPLRARGPVLTSHVIITAGPARDGTTQNTDVIWIGGKGVGLASGQPLYPGDSMELQPREGELLNLADLFALGATATDVLRLMWWPAADEANQPTGGAA